MVSESIERRLFQRFAELLEYPQPGLIEAARECEGSASLKNPKAAALLHEFRTFAEGVPLGRLEEVYSGTFDLDAACHPYVGYHLFGESYKRSVFLLELKARYRAHGFAVPEKELPDHVGVVLRFLAMSDDTILTSEIIHEALRPALERMMGKAKSPGYDQQEPANAQDSQAEDRTDHPYRKVLQSLELVLEGLPTNESSEQATEATVGDRRSPA